MTRRKQQAPASPSGKEVLVPGKVLAWRATDPRKTRLECALKWTDILRRLAGSSVSSSEVVSGLRKEFGMHFERAVMLVRSTNGADLHRSWALFASSFAPCKQPI